MALMLPTPADLDAYREGVNEADALIWAADLFTLATGITDTPEDPMEARMVTYAILDMAWFLIEDHDNREAEFSPFSSERIGSYSYSKSQGKIENSESTGVKAFDLAVGYFNDRRYGTVITSDSEWVFERGYVGSQTGRGNHDPNLRALASEPVVVVEGDSYTLTPSESVTLDEDGFPIVTVVD